MDFHWFKLVVFVPVTHKESILQCLGQAGCGKIGNYEFCSFTTDGEGRFRPLAGSNPFLGSQHELEKVAEVKIEVLCSKENLENSLKELLKTHPYEEPAIDILPVLDYHEFL